MLHVSAATTSVRVLRPADQGRGQVSAEAVRRRRHDPVRHGHHLAHRRGRSVTADSTHHVHDTALHQSGCSTVM